MEARVHARDVRDVPVRYRAGTGLRTRAAITVLVLVGVFSVALPQLADYGAAWNTLRRLDRADGVALLLVGAWNLFTYWPVLMLALPGLTLREAAVVNQASTAVANTVPGGAAVAAGVTYRMLRALGFTRESIANQLVLTGAWNNFAKLGLPLVAVLAVSITGELDGEILRFALLGLVILVVLLAIGATALRAERTTARLGAWLDHVLARARSTSGGPRTDLRHRVSRARERFRELVRASGAWLSVATLVSHLSLYAVLLVSLRAVGVSGGDASWAKVLAAFALVRLLSAIPITPGGVGIVELGYVAFLSAGTTDVVAAAVTAGVLLFRAITYVLPVVFGSAAAIAFRMKPDWRRPTDSRSTSLRLHEEAT